MEFSQKIVKFDVIPIDNVLFNEDNWKIHPVRQQNAMKSALDRIGWTDTVTINLRTSKEWGKDQGVETLIDGHMRVMIAARNHDRYVPAIYVDLDPEQEVYYLITHDPLGTLAAADEQKLRALHDLAKSEADQHAIAALRGAGVDGRKTFAHIETAAQEDQPKEPPMPKAEKRLEQKYPLAIVLDRKNWERWQTVKQSIGARTDTEALTMLLELEVKTHDRALLG